ncbi:MAG: ABC transporter permease [Microbacteriaceae bacterium]|nr:ABC transporter permease [Microbacteriaceae bacterium]
MVAITSLILTFIYLPLLVVLINSFNSSINMKWPPPSFTLIWWQKASQSAGLLDALFTSLTVAAAATIIALVLGTLLAMALSRYKFFGRNAVSLMIILPIALPGIVTGIALNNAFRTILGFQLSMITLIIAHATFCIVTVYNNALARLNRMGKNMEEASADLGAGVFTTFRLVTLPQMLSALVAGGLLAFGLSFDEIIVTTFTAGGGTETLPIWILNNMFRPGKAPIVDVVAVFMVLVSIIPIYFAQRLTANESKS